MSTPSTEQSTPTAPGPFTGRLGFGRSSALVVVDMVRAYTEPQFPLYAGEGVHDVVASIARLLGAARTAGIPIAYTGVRYNPGGIDGGVFFRKVPPLELFVGETEAGQIVPEVAPIAGEPVFLKQYPSAFCGTPLASMLHAAGVDTVILTGVSTSGCIRASATDAMQQGLIPIVVRQAVGDRHPGPHEANLFDIAAKIGDVVEEAEALEHLRQIR
jgi:maleamate amidohydrolase